MTSKKKIQGMKTFEMMEGFKPEDIQYHNNLMTGNKEIGYHIIFNIKTDGKFSRKARLVSNGNENEYIPKWDTYS